MYQLIWWYLLHVKNKFGQGDILLQLAFKTASSHQKHTAVQKRLALLLSECYEVWNFVPCPCLAKRVFPALCEKSFTGWSSYIMLQGFQLPTSMTQAHVEVPVANTWEDKYRFNA